MADTELMEEKTMNNLLKPDIAAFILRVSLGTVLLAHSVYLKLFVFTLPGTADFFISIGLPGLLAYLVFMIEAVAGIALILGVRTRLFSVLIIPVLLGATWAHGSSGWLFTNAGGGWEYPLFLSVMALVQLVLGDGRYALLSTTRQTIP
jgi:putative oxidoreductase